MVAWHVNNKTILLLTRDSNLYRVVLVCLLVNVSVYHLSMNLWAEFLPSKGRGVSLNALSVNTPQCFGLLSVAYSLVWRQTELEAWLVFESNIYVLLKAISRIQWTLSSLCSLEERSASIFRKSSCIWYFALKCSFIRGSCFVLYTTNTASTFYFGIGDKITTEHQRVYFTRKSNVEAASNARVRTLNHA